MPLHASSSPRRRGYNTGLHYTFCRDRVTVGENKSSAPERTLQEGLRKTHTSSQLLGNAARCVNTISYAFQCRKHSSQSYLQRPAGSPQLMPVGCLQALTGRACLAACASSLLRAVSSCPTCVLFACVPGLSQPASQFTLLSWPEACFYGARGVWTANLLCTQKHIALHSVNIRPYTSLTALCFHGRCVFWVRSPRQRSQPVMGCACPCRGLVASICGAASGHCPAGSRLCPTQHQPQGCRAGVWATLSHSSACGLLQW